MPRLGDLLDASKIEAGHLELRLEEYDARTLVRDVYDLFNNASPNIFSSGGLSELQSSLDATLSASNRF